MRRKILLKQFMDWAIASNSLLFLIFLIQKFIQIVVSAQFLHKFCTAIACIGYILLVRCVRKSKYLNQGTKRIIVDEMEILISWLAD